MSNKFIIPKGILDNPEVRQFIVEIIIELIKQLINELNKEKNPQ